MLLRTTHAIDFEYVLSAEISSFSFERQFSAPS